MAGKANAVAERMAAVAEALTPVVERGAQALATLESATDPAGVDKIMRATRAAALAGRGVLALAVDAERIADASAAEGDEEDDRIDEDDDGDPEELEALRHDVERRFARFDVRCGALGGDPAHAAPRADGGAEVVGGPGARPPAAAA